MNPVFLFHEFQANVHIREIDKKIEPENFEFFQLSRDVEHDARDNIGIYFLVNRFQSAKVVGAYPTCFSQIQNLIDRFPISKCKIAVEQIKRALYLFPLQDSICLVAVALQRLNDISPAVGFCTNELSNSSQIDLGDLVETILKVAQSGKQQPFHPEPVGAKLESNQFSVPIFTLFVADAHLADGVPGCNDSRPTADQRLEIVDEVAPTIAALFTGDRSRLPEEDRQDNSRGCDKPKQDQQPLLVQIRQSFPRNPYYVSNQSHFFRGCESTTAGFPL